VWGKVRFQEVRIAVRELCFMAFHEAMEGINLKRERIGASIVCSASEYDKQRSPASVVVICGRCTSTQF